MSDRFYCINCERTFDKYDKVYEPDGLDTPPYRYTPVCPFCKNDYFGEIIDECRGCGRLICEGDMYYKVNDGFSSLYCEDCVEEKG